MEIDFKVEVDHRWVYERPYKVTLTRGAKGDYRFEIEARAELADNLVPLVDTIDRELREKYGGLEPTEEEG